MDHSVKQFLIAKGMGDSKIYGMAYVRNKKFTGSLYDETLTYCNSNIEFNDPEIGISYGQIECFVETEDEGKLGLVKLFNVENLEYFYHKNTNTKVNHIIPITET